MHKIIITIVFIGLLALGACKDYSKTDGVVGPSFKEIAQRYNHVEKLAQYPAGAVIKGSKGVYGTNEMPPHSDFAHTDVAEMTRYILSVKYLIAWLHLP